MYVISMACCNTANSIANTLELSQSCAKPSNSFFQNLSIIFAENVIPTAWMDMLSVENDFPSRAHCLVRWYGLRDFLILAPDADFDAITSESKVNIVLSSIAIALHNTGW